jgi:radical SAM-linked protein
VIHRAWESGARYDGWTEHFSHERWLRALEDCGLTAEMFTRRFDLDETLPWDHIDIGILKKWLVREREKTDRIDETPDCRYGDCVACGIPGMPDDTRLTPELSEERKGALLDRASAGASRRGPGEATWPVRIRFAKRGPARFLSHLETGSILARAFRLSGIPVAHSKGFSPHPKFQFGPPLPVGIASEVELFDAEIEVPWRTDYIEKLNHSLPDGFHIHGARPIRVIRGRKRKSITALAQRGAYVADLSRLPVDRLGRVDEEVARFQEAEEWIIPKRRDAPPDSAMPRDWEEIFQRLPQRPEDPKARVVDLKKACIDLAWDRASARASMILQISDPAGHTANPTHILRGLFGLTPEESARGIVVRTSIQRADGTELFEEGAVNSGRA